MSFSDDLREKVIICSDSERHHSFFVPSSDDHNTVVNVHHTFVNSHHTFVNAHHTEVITHSNSSDEITQKHNVFYLEGTGKCEFIITLFDIAVVIIKK